MKSGVLWSATNNAEPFIVGVFFHTQPLPSTLSKQLPSAVSGGGRISSGETVHDRPALSTRALILWFLSRVNYKSEMIKVAGEYPVEVETEAKKTEEQTSVRTRVLSERRGGTEILYLDSPHASTHLEKNCTDKPAALCYETSFWAW